MIYYTNFNLVKGDCLMNNNEIKGFSESSYRIRIKDIDNESRMMSREPLIASFNHNGKEVSHLEARLKALENSCEKMYDQYDELIGAVVEMNIDNTEFEKLSSQYNHDFDPILIETKLTKMQLANQKGLQERLKLLNVILSIPYGNDRTTLTVSGQRKVYTLDALYKSFLALVLKEREECLNHEVDMIRAQLRYNNNSNYSANPKNKYYLNSDQMVKQNRRLIYIKEELKNIEKQIKDIGKMDFAFGNMQLGDFVNPNTDGVYQQFFSKENKRYK